MKYQAIKAAVCTGLWVTAIGLGLLGTWRDDIRVMFWAEMVALISCVASGVWITECARRRERIRIEDLLDGLLVKAREARQEAEAHIPRVH